MNNVFTAVLNMSVTAAFVIAALCLTRLVLQKMRAPRWISYALWAVAGFRLAVPLTLESIFSLIPSGIPEVTAPPRVYLDIPPRPSGTQEWIKWALSSDHSAYSKPVWSVFDTLTVVWLIGVAAMLLYAVISYIRLICRKDSVTTPFVYGFIKPKIHIPGGLAGEELRYVTLHEQTHIKRRDYLVKSFAFALLCVHWFNPLAWLAFVLLCADMEMSCDERVLRELGLQAKADYSQTLLALSMNRRILGASPLAFGEGGVKGRVKNVLNFKKPSRWAVLAAAALAAALTVGFAMSRGDAEKIPHIPDVFAYDTNDMAVEAEFLKFGFEWDYGVVDAFAVWQGDYAAGNTLTVAPDVTIGVAHPADRDVTIMSSTLYLPDGMLDTENCAFTENGGVFVQAPTEAGEYICELTLEYAGPRLEASYGLKIVVSGAPAVDFSALSALRTPYVGDNSAVGKIIDALPPMGTSYKQRFFSIGDDYGTGYAPYTLTVYYEFTGDVKDEPITPDIPVILFDLIDNLEEVTIAVRNTPADELDKSAYSSKATYSRNDIGETVADTVPPIPISEPLAPQDQITAYLTDMMTAAYSPFYEGLRFEMSNYAETLDGESITATFYWTMYHLNNGLDVSYEIGLEEQGNFSLQATARLDESGNIVPGTIKILSDTAARGPAEYTQPIEDFFNNLPEPSQTQITAKNNSAAARTYYPENGLGEITKLELADVSGDIEGKFKDETVAFFIELASDPYKHPARVIILSRETGGEWEIISER